MQRYEYIPCRREPQLRLRLARRCVEHHVNTIAWLRDTINNALTREGVLLHSASSQSGSRAALLVWQPHRLEDGSWGSIYHGDPSSLPPELVGERIIVTDSNGDSFSTTITAVLERSNNLVVVADSGRSR